MPGSHGLGVSSIEITKDSAPLVAGASQASLMKIGGVVTVVLSTWSIAMTVVAVNSATRANNAAAESNALASQVANLTASMAGSSASAQWPPIVPSTHHIPLTKTTRNRPTTTYPNYNATDPKTLMNWPPSMIGYRHRRLSEVVTGDSGAVEGAAWGDYSATVTIDSTSMQVIIDSGSSTFAVAAAANLGCSDYFPGTCTGTQISNYYGSGQWTAKMCTGHTVTFDGLSAGTPPVAGIQSAQGFFSDCDASASTGGVDSQGIVGMAYASLSNHAAQFPDGTLFDSVATYNNLAKVWSMACCGWGGGTTAGTGTLVLGGIHTDLYTGSFEWTPIVDQSYYCVQMDSPSTSTMTTGCTGGNAIIDSGTSSLVLTPSAYDEVYQTIFASNPSLASQQCVTKSDITNLPCIQLKLKGGVTLNIPPTNYYQPVPGANGCLEFLIQQGPGSEVNIIGQVMMESYYTVFDQVNHRVGFAPLAGCPTAPQACTASQIVSQFPPAPPASSTGAYSYGGISSGSSGSSGSSTSCGQYHSQGCVACTQAPVQSDGNYCGWCSGMCVSGDPKSYCKGSWAWISTSCPSSSNSYQYEHSYDSSPSSG